MAGEKYRQQNKSFQTNNGVIKMAKLKKSWQEKLNDDKDLPKVVEVNEKMSKRWGTGTVVIPAPREVDGIMRMVPDGKLITINQIREVLANKHKASFG